MMVVVEVGTAEDEDEVGRERHFQLHGLLWCDMRWSVTGSVAT